MDDLELNGLIKKIYYEKIERELMRPDLAREKENFIAEHFSEEPVGAGFGGRLLPEFIAPALALMLVFGVFNFLLPEQPGQKPRAALKPTAPAIQAKEVLPRKDDAKQLKKLLGKTKKSKQAAPVIVKKVSSKVGSTMVYHKKHEDTPITIVWVFTKGQV